MTSYDPLEEKGLRGEYRERDVRQESSVLLTSTSQIQKLYCILCKTRGLPILFPVLCRMSSGRLSLSTKHP